MPVYTIDITSIYDSSRYEKGPAEGVWAFMSKVRLLVHVLLNPPPPSFRGVRSANPGMTSGDILATQFAPELCKFIAPLNRGRRECRVHAAPAVSCANCAKKAAHEHTGEAEAVRHPLRNGVTAYFVLSPVERACCHRHLAENFPQGLAPASRRQDHTTSPYASAFSSGAKDTPDAEASITPSALRFVTIAKRPSCGPRMGDLYF